MKAPNDREIASVLSLPAPKRYSNFVKRAADDGFVWVVREVDGLVMGTDASGVPALMLWPHERYVDFWLAANPGGVPERVPIIEFIKAIAPELAASRRKVHILPSPDGHAITIDPSRLVDDLLTELSRFG